MVLPTLLVSDLLDWLATTPDGVPRRVLLWLDPTGDFKRLAAHLGPELEARAARLLAYDPETGMGQLALKLALLRLEGEADARAVVYLPGFGPSALDPRPDGSPPDLWSVYDYRYKGCVWGRGETWETGQIPEPLALLPWLARHGVLVADASAAKDLTDGGGDSLLARYAERQRATDPASWPRPLRVDDVRAALGGDPRETLRGLLNAPHHEINRWGDDAPLVVARLNEEYGLVFPGAGGEGADHATIVLALAEAWDAFGRPPDFPFLAKLPPKIEHRDHLARFLRDDVLSHIELGLRFRQRMARLEADYDLTSWAKGRTGQPAGLPHLARARWAAFLERLGAAASGGWKRGRDVVLSERAAIDTAAAGPLGRAVAEDLPPWSVAADLAALLDGGMTAAVEAETCRTAAELIATYAGRWWILDRLHRRVRGACARRTDLTEGRRLADLAYVDWVARASDRLAVLVEADPTWPPPGTTGVAAMRDGLWGNGAGRRAVVVADAVRWELAVALRDRLEGTAPELTPVIATLPTETPFGMTALLPFGDGPLTVAFTAGKPTIRQAGGPDLATRDGRKAFLQSTLVNRAGKATVDFVDLADLLSGSPIPATPRVVVFDNALDEQGHLGSEDFPDIAEGYVEKLKRAIDRLHGADVATVHLVTDHGFLLLPPGAVDDLQHPTVPPHQTLHKDFRWAALKPGVATTEVLRLPLPLDPEITLGLARGTRTLIKAEAYLHGGLSLQECVIPHLVSRRVFAVARLGLDLAVATTRLTGGTIVAILRPVPPPGQASLGGAQPVRARLTVRTLTRQPPVDVVTPIDVELRDDVAELKQALYLNEGIGLAAGQNLLLQATDVETGRDLGTIPLTMAVDWE